MSTYNGQKYIRDQLDSLLAQEGVSLHIIVRDDGSKDETPQILAEYASKNQNILVLTGQNCGAEKSFNALCRYALQNDNAEYYAFCDQDDVWEIDKLDVATKKLENSDPQKPNLYFSNLKMVDDQLNYIRDFYAQNEVFTNREKTLVQIFTYGCTCVFNRKALIYYCGIDKQETFHDNWIYCICSYLGNVIYDPIGHILYRQHSSNLSGHRTTGAALFFSRVKRLFKGRLGHNFEVMARQLLFFREELNPNDLKTINRVAYYRHNFIYRLSLLFSTSFRTGNFIKNLCIKYRIIINRL